LKEKNAVKKTIEVTQTTTVEVDVPDEMLTPESLAEFSKFMFPIENSEQMLLHVAKQVVRHNISFVEGVGDVVFIEQDYDVSAQIS
jgi:hypothetical protein